MYWYENDVKLLETNLPRLLSQPLTLFYGSSSFRLWPNLYQDFNQYNPVNLGFGGSTLAACTWFFDRLTAPLQAKGVVIYAGDNDLGDGRHPEEVFIFFQQLAVKISQRYGDIPCYFISIKPSLARWDIADALKYTNNIIESEIIRQNNHWSFINIFQPMLTKSGLPNPVYFEPDGLHLSAVGYNLWKSLITAKLSPLLIRR